MFGRFRGHHLQPEISNSPFQCTLLGYKRKMDGMMNRSGEMKWWWSSMVATLFNLGTNLPKRMWRVNTRTSAFELRVHLRFRGRLWVDDDPNNSNPTAQQLNVNDSATSFGIFYGTGCWLFLVEPTPEWSSSTCLGQPTFMQYANELFSHDDWAVQLTRLARAISARSPSLGWTGTYAAGTKYLRDMLWPCFPLQSCDTDHPSLDVVT